MRSSNRMAIGGFVAASVVALVALIPASAPRAEAWAAEAASAEDQALASYGRGLALYQRYCRTCHGKSAKGDGHVAQWLKVPPSDLTTMAARNEGGFPAERARRIIDGREEARTHGRREMPIWGKVLLESDSTKGADPAAEGEVKSKIDDLLVYLEEIQVEASGGGG